MGKRRLIKPKRIAEPYAKLHNFLGTKPAGGDDFQGAFGRVAAHLKRANEEGNVQILVGIKGGQQSWVLTLKKEICEIAKATIDSPRFEVIIKAEALEKVMEGKISPIFAMAKGEMRVRGDLEFGKRIYKLLASDDGRIDPCN